MDRWLRSRNLKMLLTKEVLYNEYINNKLSSYKIAEKYQCSKNVVLKYLKLFNIPWRNKSESQLGKIISEETRKRLRISHLGQPNKYKGVTNRYSKEYLKKMSEVRIGLLAGNKHPNWKGGIGRLNYHWSFNDQLKLKIRTRDNFTCQCCGLKEENHYRGGKNIKLTVHHIDYNRQNCKEDNLITLCNICNVKANGNKELDRDYWFAYYTYIMENFILKGV